VETIMLRQETRIPSRQARNLLLEGHAPEDLCISGHLDLSGQERALHLPAGLRVASLDLSGCTRLTELPAQLEVQHLTLNGCTRLTSFPAGLRCEVLEACGTALRSLPPDLQVTYKLDLQHCTQLSTLPARLTVQQVLLCRCSALTTLPTELEVCHLDLSGCMGLADWPTPRRLKLHRLDLSGCARLRELPANLGKVAELNLAGCTQLRQLPADLQVSGWLDLTGTGVTALPDSLRGVRLRWRNVFVEPRIVFQPETITVEEILSDRNAERRRVLLERLGYDRFFQDADAEVLDADRDPGGERRLLRVAMRNDEDVVCVAVCCPSTGRQYLLRVPPHTMTCRQAAAWLAGFEDPEEYNPLVET
jgi:hypothetical protein